MTTRSLRLERCAEWLDAALRVAPFIIFLALLALAAIFLLGVPAR